ncbi:MAG: ECF-type sigma factor [Planctomycetota bacterium]|jgi:RNA polymerase sigma factor (TIGR02999 family)
MAGQFRNTQHLIDAASAGDSAAQKQLFSILYKELHTMAHKAMLKEQFDDMLQTTALVHEAYLSLVRDKRASWRNKEHFYRVAARVMRCILVDEARKRTAAKRKPFKPRLSLDAMQVSRKGINISEKSLKGIQLLDKALEKLSKNFDRKCTVVELRYFAGLTIEQTAQILGISKATVKRDWDFTREWLRKELILVKNQ